jgi:hypothetical protein
MPDLESAKKMLEIILEFSEFTPAWEVFGFSSFTCFARYEFQIG